MTYCDVYYIYYYITIDNMNLLSGPPFVFVNKKIFFKEKLQLYYGTKSRNQNNTE